MDFATKFFGLLLAFGLLIACNAENPKTEGNTTSPTEEMMGNSEEETTLDYNEDKNASGTPKPAELPSK